MGKKKASADLVAPRFGLGEWYGHAFHNLSGHERKGLAEIALRHTKANAPLCPFKIADKNMKCSKNGGVCSLRLYECAGDGTAVVMSGEKGDLRAMCPNRFKQEGLIYRRVSEIVLGIDTPLVTDEVRFLQRDTDEEDSAEDVGNIDNVLIDPENLKNWCALEIQTVYFSGKGMKSLFQHIRDFDRNALPFPDEVRRPDYRSSGPKRLMPQLQIKVPTLRRWGKKMAVVVDVAWFRTNVVGVEEVRDLSNADIAWCLVEYNESTDPAMIEIREPKFQTLERAVDGLTGGYPVTLSEFEAKTKDKLIKKKLIPRPR